MQTCHLSVEVSGIKSNFEHPLHISYKVFVEFSGSNFKGYIYSIVILLPQKSSSQVPHLLWSDLSILTEGSVSPELYLDL